MTFGNGNAPQNQQFPLPLIVSFGPLGVLTPHHGANGPSNFKLTPELQYARCMSNRYRSDAFPRCVSCTRRWAGDTCRFQHIRVLLRDESKVVQAISFTGENSIKEKTGDAQRMKLPDKWNVALEQAHIEKITVRYA